MSKSNQHDSRWETNRKHWNETLDAKNLDSDFDDSDFEKEVALYKSRDVRDGIMFFQPLLNRWVLDLGGGLGLSSYLFLRGGAKVVLCDISPKRCEIAKTKLEALGFKGNIHCVVASSDALPFKQNAFDRIWTKSVLIHVKLKETANELARILNSNDGQVWIIEPMRNNPFVNLYRRLEAPKIWQEITTYFSKKEYSILRNAFLKKTKKKKPVVEMRHYYWLSFLASGFAFKLQNAALFRLAESILVKVDDLICIFFPSIKKQSWFGVLAVRYFQESEKKTED